MTPFPSRGLVFAIAVLMAVGPVAGSALATHDGGPPDAWTQEAKFTPAPGRLGATVALDAAGDTALVGAPTADNRAGTTFVFEKTASGWSQQVEIAAPTSDGAFARSVDLDAAGDTALVGAEGEQAAYVYSAASGGWSDGFSKVRLTPDGATDNTQFGRELALDDDGDTALVADPGTSFDKAGEIFVFEDDGSSWIQEFSKAASGTDSIGRSLALDGVGQTAFVSVPGGQAKVLERGSEGWAVVQTLTGGNRFGKAVAIDGDTALVGDSTNLSQVRVFEHVGGVWEQTDTIDDGQETTTGSFGASIALDGDTALIGDPITLTSGGWRAGAAFVYEDVGDAWARVDRLVPEDGVPGGGSSTTLEGNFGSATAIAGGIALVGAPTGSPTEGLRAGAGYVFTDGCEDDGIVHDALEPAVAGAAGSGAADTVHEQNCRWT